MRYEEMGGPPPFVEQPLYQLVALDQDSPVIGMSPTTGTHATQAIQDLPPTPVPSEPPAKPPPPATTQQSCSSC